MNSFMTFDSDRVIYAPEQPSCMDQSLSDDSFHTPPSSLPALGFQDQHNKVACIHSMHQSSTKKQEPSMIVEPAKPDINVTWSQLPL